MVDYFVSAEGSDSADGRSEATAWRNVSVIPSKTFAPGDRILFRRGDSWPVNWAVALKNGGAADSPIRLDCYGNAAAPYPEIKLAKPEGFCALKLDRPYLIAAHLNITSARNGIVISNAPACDLHETVAADCAAHGIQVSRLDGPSPGVSLKSNQAIRCGGSGITLTTEQDLVCSFNRAHQCCLDTVAPASSLDLNYSAGIKIFGCYGSSNVLIEHNVCEENGNTVQTDAGVALISKGMGLWIDTCDAGAVVARNNVCRNNVNSGMMIELSQRIDVYNNRCYGNGRNNSTAPNKAGIVLHRGAARCRVKFNVCFDNPYQTLVTGYAGHGEEGLDQVCADNVFEEDTLVSRAGQVAYACLAPCDPARQVRVNEVEALI